MSSIRTLQYLMIVGMVAFTFSLSAMAYNVSDPSPQDSAQENAASTPENSSTVKSLGTLRSDELRNTGMSETPTQATSAGQVNSSMPSVPPMQPMQAGNITYITGGVGEDERTELQSMRQNYNLQVMNATKNGELVGTTTLSILDRKGQELLNVPIGPLFYAQLPPGTYTLQAKSEAGEAKIEKVAIGGHKPAYAHFSWQ